MKTADTILIKDIDGIEDAARKVLAAIGDRPVVAFHGDMGAGKTTLINAISRILGAVDDATSSPSFSIVNEYVGADGNTIYHFDLYRLNDIEEAYDMGFEDYIDSGNLCMIEWPDIAESLLPDDAVHISVRELEDGSREVSVI
ncbi:MAG: tRNA (adenosine(37)-N6)-threonylcarbamoyltransferase complex ATPase subunit type 1 TsaE [Muribaculaceae bacterium]|nr:tRNA (adenosine(37)-N6)-threonylcarbamoyltransferase complex ATPase subunit type 1 TsaE [Muribaculaceae bacterium]